MSLFTVRGGAKTAGNKLQNLGAPPALDCYDFSVTILPSLQVHRPVWTPYTMSPRGTASGSPVHRVWRVNLIPFHLTTEGSSDYKVNMKWSELCQWSHCYSNDDSSEAPWTRASPPGRGDRPQMTLAWVSVRSRHPQGAPLGLLPLFPRVLT